MVTVYTEKDTQKVRYSLQDIPLAEILFKNTEYCHRYTFEDEALLRSIRKWGLLTPPFLVQRSNYFVIVSGFKRLHCLRTLKVHSVSALTLSSPALSPQDIFLIALENNGSSLNDLEKSIALNKAQNNFCFDREIMRCIIAPLLGLDPSLKRIDEYIKIDTLIPALKRLLAQKQLHFHSAVALTRFSRHEQNILYKNVLQHCFFSMSELKSFCDLTYTIIRREKISLAALLSRKTIRLLTKKKNISPREKGIKMLGYLRDCNYPYLTQLRDTVRRIKNKCTFTKNICLNEPTYFEEDDFTVTISFSTIGELKKALQCIHNNLKTIEMLFRIDEKIHF